MAVIKPALDVLSAIFKTAWDAIAVVFKDAWDLIAAALKIALAGIEATIKTAWDLITGIFTVALDLLTGHWSKAWTDMESTGKQIWNAIKGDLQSVWNSITTVITQLVNNLERFLLQAWNAIKSGVISAATDLWHGLVAIWDNILADITSIVNKIEAVVSSVTSLPGKVISGVGHVLGSIGLAGGGVIPGFSPGKDSVHAMLSPGEAVLVPEAVRAIGPAKIHAINAHFSRHRGGASMAFGGIIPGFAGGGVITPNPVPYSQMLAAGILVLQQVAGMGGGSAPGWTQPGIGGMPQPYGGPGQVTHQGGNTIILQFNGTQVPGPEMMHAITTQLSAAVGVS